MLGNNDTINIEKVDEVTIDKTKISSNVGFYSKLALSVVAGAAAIYYGGPIAAISARALYDNFYLYRYGDLPGLLNSDYWKFYMPMREHIGAQAYQYGPHLFGAASATITYTTSAAIEWVGEKLKRKKALNIEAPISPDIEQGITPLIEVKIEPVPDEAKTTQAQVKQEIDLDKEIDEIIKQLMALDISGEETSKKIMTELEKELQQLTFSFDNEKSVVKATEPEKAAPNSQLKSTLVG